MNIKSVLMSVAVATMAITGSTYAQGCADCGTAASSCATGSCGNAFGADNFGSGFSYASSGCSSCDGLSGGYGGRGNLKAEWHQLQQENDQVRARNQAWPKPFDCADRQLYFSIWEPMLDAGFRKHCTLTQAHFQQGTNELNNYGRSAVAGIMQNMPNHRKTIFVHRDVDSAISDARIGEVRNVVQTWYGNQANATVAFTNQLPSRSSGDRIEVINGLYREGTPPPTIPVANGSGDVSGD